MTSLVEKAERDEELLFEGCKGPKLSPTVLPVTKITRGMVYVNSVVSCQTPVFPSEGRRHRRGKVCLVVLLRVVLLD